MVMNGNNSREARKFQKRYHVGQLFTPATPINDRQLFAGRIAQVQRVVDTVSQRGLHAILFGERGVGKTSLANVLSGFLQGTGKAVIAPRVSCASSDTYSQLWHRVFQQITFVEQRETLGLRPETVDELSSLADSLPTSLTPDIVRMKLEGIGSHCVLILIVDEFSPSTLRIA